MEKEFNIDKNGFCINFFVKEDQSLLTENDINSISILLASSISEFLKSDLNRNENIELNINLVDIQQIKEINSEHRGKDKETDVLSFPLNESIRDGDFDAFDSKIELGDLFICGEVCESQAEEFKLSFVEEFLHLAVHGCLHLLGYDHEISDEEEKIMESYEEKILLNIKKLRKNS